MGKKKKNRSCRKIKMEVHSRKHYTLTIYLEIKLKRKLNGDGNLIKIEVELKQKWKLHKIKLGSSFVKPLYLNDLFGN